MKTALLSMLLLTPYCLYASQSKHLAPITYTESDVQLLKEVNDMCLSRIVPGSEIHYMIKLSQEKIDLIKNATLKQQAQSYQQQMRQNTHNVLEDILRDLDVFSD